MRIIALAALTLLLTGCAPTDPVVTSVPVPRATPLFATDADALKAAEVAYAAYLKVSDQILADGGVNPERINTVAVGTARQTELAGYEKIRASGNHSTGTITFSSVRLELYDPNVTHGEGIVRIYACEDISGTDLVDARGISVIGEGRVVRIPVEVGFQLSSSSRGLVVSSEDVWAGKGICA